MSTSNIQQQQQSSSNDNLTVTENGALSLSTTGVKCLDLFFKTVRKVPTDQLEKLLAAAWAENPLDTLKIIFYTRDIRGGKGERLIFHQAVDWLISKKLEKHFLVNIDLVLEYGRYEDLLHHLNENEKVTQQIVDLFAKQLKQDLANMNEAKPISLAAKWAPTEGGKHDKKSKAVKKIISALGCTYKEYRKNYLSPLREYLKIVEKLMCEKRWSEIDYSKVPSKAMNKLKKAFQKNDTKRFEEWMEKLKSGDKTVKVNSSTLDPHELVNQYMKGHAEDTVIEEQWKGIRERTAALGVMSKSVVLSDVSGSMSGEPLQVSIALGILISELTKAPYNGLVITFEENPRFHTVVGSTLKEKVDILKSMPWGGSTDFQAAFDLLLSKAKEFKLPPSEMPEKLYVISDMQFNQAGGKTNFDAIKEKYSKAGYAIPQIIFWNVRGGTSDFTNNAFDQNVAMVSGFSPSILKAVLNGKDFSPIGIMKQAINDPRYEKIKLAQ